MALSRQERGEAAQAKLGRAIRRAARWLKPAPAPRYLVPGLDQVAGTLTAIG